VPLTEALKKVEAKKDAIKAGSLNLQQKQQKCTAACQMSPTQICPGYKKV